MPKKIKNQKPRRPSAEAKERLIDEIIESLQPVGMEMGSDLKSHMEFALEGLSLKDVRHFHKEKDNWIFDWQELTDGLVNNFPLTEVDSDLLNQVSHETRPDFVTTNLEKMLIPISAILVQAWGLGNLGKVKRCIGAVSTIITGARRLIEKQLYHNLK